MEKTKVVLNRLWISIIDYYISKMYEELKERLRYIFVQKLNSNEDNVDADLKIRYVGCNYKLMF